MDRITRSQWDQIPNDYKTVIDGQRYILKRDDERGTVLVPVEVVDDNAPAGSENGQPVRVSFTAKRPFIMEA